MWSLRIRSRIKSHRRTVGVVFGFACGLIAGGAIQLAEISGASFYAIWTLTICVVLAVVAPWALRGTGRRIPVQEAFPPKFQLVRLWYGRSLVVSEEEEAEGFSDADLDFLADGRRYEQYEHVND